MPRFLMVESWIGSAGEALPRALRARGDRFVLLTRDPDRYGHAGAPARVGAEAHPAAGLADEVLTADTHDLAATRAAAAVAHRAEPFDGVLTTCDHYLEAVAVVARELGLPGAEPAAVRLALRKDLVRRALSDAGLPNPAFAAARTLRTARRAADRLGYPLVAKPFDLHSSTLVRRIEHHDGLAAWFADAAEVGCNSRGHRRQAGVLLEEVMTGPEVSVETATAAGVTTVIGITDKSLTGSPGYVESGHQFPAPLDETTGRRAARLVCAALAAIGWSHGVGHTEVMLTPAGPRIVEMNPRQGGNHIFELVRLVTGRSTLDAVADLAQGRAPASGDGWPAAGGDGRPTSAAVQFVMAPRSGRLVSLRGADGLAADPHVERWSLPAVLPRDVRRPADNEDYLGHVLTVDRTDRGARPHAERAVAGLTLVLADGTEMTPLGASAPQPTAPG
jgi:biotin carboxylase